jgi:thioredoxin reductase
MTASFLLQKLAMKIFDIIIVGGGPAGLNAAVVLGRCKRSVLVFDTGIPRNKHSQGIHNYITRDGILPADFILFAQKEIRKYAVGFIRTEIIKAQKNKNIFILGDKAGNKYHTKKLLLATGVKDKLPAIPGIEEFYGRSVFHCPYCDGWEVRNKMLGIYAKNKNGFALAVSLKTWSQHVTLYTDGRNYLKQLEIDILKRKKIEIVSAKIKSFEGRNGQLQHIVFTNGEKKVCEALFFTTGFDQQSHLAEQLGCRLNKKGVIETYKLEQTSIPGLYVAGDSSKDMQFVVVAAAEGAKAAVNINKELQKEEMLKRQ